jgi:aminoglycoside 6'-N-acetyltransferase I
MTYRVADLTRDATDTIEQTAALLRDAFRGRSEDWQDLVSAREEVLESLEPERISRVALDPAGAVLGWIGGIPMYHSRVWELHPLAIAHRAS